MYNWFVLSLIFFWGVSTYFFYTVISNRKKLHHIRMKMLEKGEIKLSANYLIFIDLVFWMIPIRKFINKKNEEHNKLAKKINKSLLNLFIILVISYIFMIIAASK